MSNTARFKKGFVVRPFGATSKIDNSNLTDEIAGFLLDSGRVTKDAFEVLPGKPKTTTAPAKKTLPSNKLATKKQTAKPSEPAKTEGEKTDTNPKI